MTISIVVADDHPIVLDGLVQLFSTDPEFRVIARCIDGGEALSAIRSTQPDVAVVDIHMPRVDGVEVLRTAREEGLSTRIVLLTGHMTEEKVIEAIRLGAAGIVLKEAAPRQLLESIREVVAGATSIDPKVVRRAVEKMLRAQVGTTEVARLLTPREIEIVRLVAKGLRNKEIAEKLSITEGTVKIHLHTIYEKTGVSGRIELSNYARSKSLA